MILLEKCFEFAKNLATINFALDKVPAFESFIESKLKEIDVETRKKLNRKRTPFQPVEVEIYEHLLDLSAFKATKCNVYLGVSILISLGYNYYVDEPEAGERRYKFKFHAMIRDYRKKYPNRVPLSHRVIHINPDDAEPEPVPIQMPIQVAPIPTISDMDSLPPLGPIDSANGTISYIFTTSGDNVMPIPSISSYNPEDICSL